MVRPMRVFVKILSAVALPLLAVLVLLRTYIHLFGGFGSRALLHKCKGMHEYVRKLLFSSIAQEVMFVLVCGALQLVG